MTEQKIVSVRIDPMDGSKAMEQIRKAAGEGRWLIRDITSFGSVASKQVSPGINDPASADGEVALVVLERDSDEDDPMHRQRSAEKMFETMV